MNLELLRQVCVTPGAPGFEDKIRDFIIQEVAPLVTPCAWTTWAA